MRWPWITWALLLWPLASAGQEAQVPARQIPDEVIAGLKVLSRDFNAALAEDCAPEKCYAKGCVYAGHEVVDQPATGSLPGLYLEDAPPGGPDQIYLTSATCGFAYERSVGRRNARALATRLKAKMSRGWTLVEVKYEALKPLPASLREPPAEPAPPSPPDAGLADAEPIEQGSTADPEPAAAAPQRAEAEASRELWLSLLPHFSWMIALGLVTVVALILIWALRRLGKPSPEEEALLAQMLAQPEGGASAQGAEAEAAVDAVAQSRAAWAARLAGAEGDPALRALVADLLRSGERALLAKAIMTFPDQLPKAFPTDGDLASAKYEVAAYLKHVDPDQLPSDAAFFEALDRYALASTLTAHADTDLIRGLHDEFGPGALVDLVRALPPRQGALLFALAPMTTAQAAAVRLDAGARGALASELLRSNRMDAGEAGYLMRVLDALKGQRPIPAPPEAGQISDRGTPFSAAGALSVLLPLMSQEARAQAVAQAAVGGLPAWLEQVMFGDLLLKVPPSARADLMLEVDIVALACWLRAQGAEAQRRLVAEAPAALQAALSGARVPAGAQAQGALAAEGGRALATALSRRRHQGGLPEGLTLQALLS